MNRLVPLRLMIIVFALTTSAVGRAQPPGDQASQPILSEMQRLRQAVERNAIAIIATHRAAMQQQRVDALTGQEFYVRQQIASAAADQAKAESAIRALQSRIAQTPDNSPVYAQAQDALVAARSDADRAASLIQQYRSWQAELSSSLRSEQSKLNDLLDRLNSIETELQATAAGRQGR